MTVNFCQHCGVGVENREIDGINREVCPACGTIYYRQWKVSAGVRVVKDGELLLVKRGIEPWQGSWHMPAGYVEIDEEPRAAAEREAREETGLIVRADRLVDCYLDTSDPRGNVIILLYDAVIIDGVVSTSNETPAVGFFNRHDVLELPLAGNSAEKEIRDWLDSNR